MVVGVRFLNPDSSDIGHLVKQDTVIASAGTVMYSLNNDFKGENRDYFQERTRWSSLYPASVKGLETDNRLAGVMIREYISIILLPINICFLILRRLRVVTRLLLFMPVLNILCRING